ncbi:MAG TPA: CoA pyrophosphatase [Bacteroidetes bacterium]|nr:CoA pyrophosphatase [Bacteroidota bacterium]
MNKLSLHHIQQKLSCSTYAPLSHTEMRQACVMVPIVMKDDQLHLLLTKRTEIVEHHKGQISFPGGMVDEDDESSNATALREVAEEIGIPSSAITILGRLDDIHIPSGFVVTPIVGYIDSLSALKTSPDEVAEVILIPLEKFFDLSLRRTEMRELKGVERQVYLYDVWKEPVWGATAFIIKQFVDIIGVEQ